MQDEHDDDLAPSVDQRGDVETEGFPNTSEETENDEHGDEPDDENITGK